MKYFFVTILLLKLSCSNGQQMDASDAEVFRNWYKSYRGKGLHPGDRLPDFYLGTVSNSNKYKGKVRLADVKADLIILDFWNTACHACIASFPKMENLQKEFGDKIQIFLVNRSQTKEEIDKEFKKTKQALPGLPVITDCSLLTHPMWIFFPGDRVPFHVWIDRNKQVRLMGPAQNTYKEKIQEVLDGKSITFINDENTRPEFDPGKPYYKLLQTETSSSVLRSFFSSYNPDYAPFIGGAAERIIDTGGTIRYTYINTEALELVRRAVWPILKRDIDSEIFQNLTTYWPFYLLYVNDTTAYTSSFAGSSVTDKIFSNGRYCYEQLLPGGTSEEMHRQYMLDDLNRYLGNKYGTTIKVERKKTISYVLKCPSGKDKLVSKSEAFSQTDFKEGQHSLIKYSRIRLRDAFINLINNNPGIFLHSQEKFMILDGTEFTDYVDITLPKHINTFQELKDCAKRYDLDFVKEEKEIDFIVIEEKNYKGKIE